MKQPVLIYLYFDQYEGVGDVAPEALIVADVRTYVIAREAIERMKAGERVGSLTIIVRSRQHFSGFHDLPPLGMLVQTVHIAPRDEIAGKQHIQIPNGLSNRDLITLGVKGIADLLAISEERGITDKDSFDNALLVKAFGSQAFNIVPDIDFESWFTNLVAFLHSEQAPAQIGWKVEYTRQLAQERVTTALTQYGRDALVPFALDLLQKTPKGKGRIYLNQLAVRCWLKSYPKLARKAVIANLTDFVGQWQEVKDENAVLSSLSPWCECLYDETENPLVEQLESVLVLLFEEEFLDSEDLSKFIGLTSGRFETELNAVQSRLMRLFLDKYKVGDMKGQRSTFSAYIEQLDRHFKRLLDKTGQAERANWLDALLEFGDVIAYLEEATPSHWADWLATYELLIKAKRLKRVILGTTPNLYLGQIGEINANFSILNEKLNAAYSDWLLKEYPGFLTSTGGQPPLVMTAARLALEYTDRGDKVILLVLDALDWELWQNLRNAFTQKGFFVQGNEAGLAIIPTITEFSRRAIFGGLTPRHLATFVDDIYGIDIPSQEEVKILARALGFLSRIGQIKISPVNKRIQTLANELVYVNGSTTDFRQALQIEARCYALVYTEIDSHIHVSKLEEHEEKETVQKWLTVLIEGVIQGIQQNPSLRNEMNLKIIITSDHGFLDISESSKAEVDSPLSTYLDLERHGRLAIVKGSNEEHAKAAIILVKDFYDKHSTAWHIIQREHGEAFGLAASSASEGEVVAWLMPRLFQYVKKGRGNYAHGGLTMYETIVPLAVLTRGVPEIEPPVITITGKLSSEEPGTISIAIYNKNDRPIQDLVIAIPELNIGDLRAEYISPGEITRLAVTVVSPKSGDVSIHLALQGEIGGMKKHFEETCILTVQPGRVERMRLSTRRNFDDE